MKSSALFTSAVTLGLSIGCLYGGHTVAESLPRRKAGLWELTTKSAQLPVANVVKQCIDGNTDEQMMAFGSDMGGAAGSTCSKPEFKKTSAGYESSSECTVQGSKITSKATIAGDFNSSYTADVSTSFSPPLMGMDSSQMTVTAKYLGDCESGMKPGDMILPGGQKMSMDQMQDQLRQTQEMLKNQGAALSGQGGSAEVPQIDPKMPQIDPKMMEQMMEQMKQLQQQQQGS